MKKKINRAVTFLLVFVMVVSMVPVQRTAAEAVEVGRWYFAEVEPGTPDELDTDNEPGYQDELSETDDIDETDETDDTNELCESDMSNEQDVPDDSNEDDSNEDVANDEDDVPDYGDGDKCDYEDENEDDYDLDDTYEDDPDDIMDVAGANVLVLPVGYATYFYGLGTPASPFIISNEEQFMYVAQVMALNGDIQNVHALSASYVLVADLDLRDESDFLGLGSTSQPFSGTFDGNNHIVQLGISTTTISSVGLFRVASGAIIRNIIVDGSVYGTTDVAGIAGRIINNTTLDNVKNRAVIEGSGMGVAGIAGSVTNSVISGATNFGFITGGASRVAGIAAHVTGISQIENSTNYGDITSVGIQAGGIAGFASGANVVIYDNTVQTSATIRGPQNIGGLVGQLSFGTIESGRFYGSVITNGAGLNAGGIAGLVNQGTVLNSEVAGDVIGNDRAGGVTGRTQGAATISYNTVRKNVTIQGSQFVGGIVGYGCRVNIVVSNNRMLGDVIGGIQAGGIIGHVCGDSQVVDNVVYGTVNGDSWIGGIAGVVRGTSILMSNVMYGSVTGLVQTGGVAGFVDYNNRCRLQKLIFFTFSTKLHR